MGKKQLFTADFEMHASVKMLFPYISSASGLGEWLAENVTISPEKVYTFHWDKEEHQAKLIGVRTNHFAKFEYLPETSQDKKDPSYFELRLETDELTQLTYLKVTDYSDFDDVRELNDLWNSLVEVLRKTVGG